MEQKDAGSARPVGRGSRRPMGSSPQRVSPGTGSSGEHRSSSTPRGSTSPTSSSRSPGSGASPRRSPTDLIEQITDLDITDLIRRPDYGTVGQQVHLRTNFFIISLPTAKKPIEQYHMKLEHERDRKLDRDECRKIFWTFVKDKPEMFPHRYSLAYDGSAALFSLQPLNLSTDNEPKPMVKFDVHVNLPKDPRELSLIHVTIMHIGQRSLDMSLARIANVENREMTGVQILDIVMRQGLTDPFGEQAKSFYPFQSSFYRMPTPGDQTMDLGSGKELWSGFFTSVHIGENHTPILNVDVSNTMFFKLRMPMIEFMCDVLNDKSGSGPLSGGRGGGRGGRGGGYNAQGQAQTQGPYQPAQLTAATRLNASDLMALNDAVKGLKVRVAHREGQIRVYRVNKVVDSADRLMFEVREKDSSGVEKPSSISVADYFGRRYQPLRHPGLPCLHVGPIQRNIYFPIEVCEVDSPQKVAKKPNEVATAAIIRATASPADIRARKIQDLMAAACFQKDPFLQQYNVRVEPNMVELPGRVLPAPFILYGQDNNREPRVRPVDGVWDSMRQRMMIGATCRGYSLIALLPPREENTLQAFCENLWRKASEMGMQFPNWPSCVKYGRSKDDLESAFREIVAEHRMKNEPLTVKELSDMQHGIMSQCLLYKNISANKPATCSNIVLKLNMKLGGVNSQLEADQISGKYLVNQPTLVMGIDVTHPTLMEERQGMPSVATVVANIDTLPMKYGANVKVQKHCRESVVYLLDAVRERLVAYFKSTNAKPERIIVYRDGVSEGQFLEVLREELRGIRMACLMLSHDYKPKVTYVVVNKRHHARFFPVNPSEASGRAKNVKPGTCVDRSVVSPESFDFYLNSHQGIQGTCRPARYTVLSDDSKFTADEIQLLTYQLCHTYCRCPRSVSIPAPVYYAHLVATRARYHVKRRIGVHDSDSMSDAGRSGRGIASSSSSTVGPDTDAASATSRGRGRGRGAPRPSEGVGSSDSGLQDAVTVVDGFKNRMYFV